MAVPWRLGLVGVGPYYMIAIDSENYVLDSCADQERKLIARSYHPPAGDDAAMPIECVLHPKGSVRSHSLQPSLLILRLP